MPYHNFVGIYLREQLRKKIVEEKKVKISLKNERDLDDLSGEYQYIPLIFIKFLV